MKYLIMLITLVVVLVSACQPQTIGGQKDEYGCLGPAGYSWNETIGACVRQWELDESQAKAAQIAVAPISARPITVVRVLTARCPGCFMVTLQTGSGTPFDVKIINWNISNEITNFDECVAAGNPVMESYPRQCAAGDKTFTEEIDPGLTPEPSPFVKCTAEQKAAEACTMEYMPVCGDNGNTYGNKCAACASKEIESYMLGECTTSETGKEYLSNSPEECSRMGVWQCDEGYTVFTDDTGCGCKKKPADNICSDGKGNTMPIDKAHDIAVNSECGDNLIIDCACPEGYRKDGDSCTPECYYSTPSCLAPSVQCEKTYFCNEGTGTFWINMNITKPGCSPACVINLETNKAEINWRCTGVILKEI